MQNKFSFRDVHGQIQWRTPLLTVIAAAVCSLGYLAYSGKSVAQARTPDAKTEKELVFELSPADIASAESRELSSKLPLSGSLVPESQVTIRAKVVAEVAEAPMQEGVAVRKGQVIARFTAADLHARLLTQEAAVDEAQAKLALAQKNRQSNEVLLKQNYISQNAFDTTHNGLELAQANLKSAMSQKQVAQLALADTQVRAPLDGIISKRHVQPGEKVSPDSPLYSIVSLGRMTLEAQVPASEIPRVKTGQKVLFQVDGFGGREFEGKVARINPATEAGSRSMMVYIAVDNAHASLKGGMFAKGSLILEKTASTASVPLTAVRQVNGVDVVYQVLNDQVRIQPVKLGLRSDDEGHVQILHGLEPGAVVIASRLDSVKAGSRVKMPRASTNANQNPASGTAAKV
ncbi:efflux RND transporter periplasmic adaptor subunit [Undibacterium sp. TS12]|uniref:efflux RND transporter periplasmic adaptor subunit n=1 Tax=Undibacterium sp. TS12 TaxID=2908202 RepID=UPI001F4CFCF5|nr:efflux RND transporter periplasmic adaptor subunit [Undibacterium sp. TS12]MCH8619907.1 efflux RND transporter periplasmic adaptor subunit [Undibacterium sp. TS12]